MTYRIEWRPSARKAFLDLDRPVRDRIGAAVEKLTEDPRPAGVRALTACPAYYASESATTGCSISKPQGNPGPHPAQGEVVAERVGLGVVGVGVGVGEEVVGDGVGDEVLGVGLGVGDGLLGVGDGVGDVVGDGVGLAVCVG